jgi:hypothetical protein
MIAKLSIQLNCDFHIVGFGAGDGQGPKSSAEALSGHFTPSTAVPQRRILS